MKACKFFNFEILAKKISKKTSFNLIGLRFFTVYGEWGRPDMFIFKLLNSHKNNKKFYLNNYGNHERDFTYVEDIAKAVSKLCFKIPKKKKY